MGLISLPATNRVGIYSYWNNVWDKSINYTMYLYSDFFIDIFFLLFFDDLTFNYLHLFFSKKLKVYKKGYLNFVKKINTIINYLYLGKIWFFMYQNWIIIKLVLYFPSKDSRKAINKNINLVKLYNIYLAQKNRNNFKNNYTYLNYKYKI